MRKLLSGLVAGGRKICRKKTSPASNGEELVDESGYNKLRASTLFSSRWVGTTSDEKAVLITMLAMKDKNGFVSASVSGIAKQAEVSREITRAFIEKLKSPDSDSRTKDNEGRTIVEVNGGFLFLNHFLHRDGKRKKEVVRETGPSTGTSPALAHCREGFDSIPQMSDQIRSDGISNTNSITDRITESWHPAERAALAGMTELEQKVFVKARSYAERAAAKGEPHCPIIQNHVAKGCKCSQPHISGVINKFVDKKYLIVAVPSVKVKGRNTQARYRWNLPTTLSMPPWDEDGDDSDLSGSASGRTAAGNEIPF